MDTSAVLATGLLLAVLFTGCLSTAPGQETTSQPPAPTATSNADLPCATSLGFYGSATDDARGWNSTTAVIGYTLETSASVVFVALENESVIGTTHAENDGVSEISSDGDTIPLDEQLDGTHTLRVVAFHDADGDGEYDEDADEPCRNDGSVVETEQSLDFGDSKNSSV